MRVFARSYALSAEHARASTQKCPRTTKAHPSSRKHAPSSGVTFSAKATRVVVGQQYNPVIQPSAGQSKRQTHPGKVTAGSHRAVDVSRIAGMAAVEVILVGIEEVLHPGVDLRFVVAANW